MARTHAREDFDFEQLKSHGGMIVTDYWLRVTTYGYQVCIFPVFVALLLLVGVYFTMHGILIYCAFFEVFAFISLFW
jgi:hypothetical protein